jgi:hypothetical protein
LTRLHTSDPTRATTRTSGNPQATTCHRQHHLNNAIENFKSRPFAIILAQCSTSYRFILIQRPRMKPSQLLLFAAPATSSVFNIFPRAVSQDYLNSVCSPNITNPTVVPPCISVITIEGLCQPNGTSPLDYQASAQCLCNPPSTYFADWINCRKCLEVHGGMSELEYNGYVLRASAASSTMCSGTPTTNIAAVFSAATYTGAPTGATTSSDQFPSSSAVSLYYTPSGPQGSGAITGMFLRNETCLE